jgi:hypothetical protein
MQLRRFDDLEEWLRLGYTSGQWNASDSWRMLVVRSALEAGGASPDVITQDSINQTWRNFVSVVKQNALYYTITQVAKEYLLWTQRTPPPFELKEDEEEDVQTTTTS